MEPRIHRPNRAPIPSVQAPPPAARMRWAVAIAFVWIAWIAAAAPAPAAGVPESGELFAPILDGLGDLHHEVATEVPLAQRYFDQGLVLAWAFNHPEAERSFRQAAALDPECAMCWWGVAWVLGPNINTAMEDSAVAPAWEALEKARSLRQHATPRGRAYIDALAARYAPPEEAPEDRAPLDRAFAEAMGEVADRFPDDVDAATLHAEALMDTTPWDYWREDGTPKPVTREILARLEGVLERDPRHPGANHLYIHAVEAVQPERGVAAAERLEDLVPGAGHLVHMPSHIYIRVGRYHDAVTANQRAVDADRAYVTQCHAQGVYHLGYVPHNHHFLWAAAAFAGQEDVAVDAARQVAAHVDTAMLRQPGFGTLQHFWVTPLYALARFGRWQEVLDEPAPAEDLLYPRGVWRWARGMAWTRMDRLEDARDELERVAELADDERLEEVTLWDINTTRSLLQVAREVLAGELAAARGDYDEAVKHLRRAVEREDGLNYDEPPPWPLPSRQYLGAVLLEAGRPGEAEAVFRADLEEYPENGWSLRGLVRALAAQGLDAEAEAVRKRFLRAWRHAEAPIASSRF